MSSPEQTPARQALYTSLAPLERQAEGPQMGGVVKFFFRLAVLAGLGFIGYAIFADLPPPEREVEIRVSGGDGG